MKIAQTRKLQAAGILPKPLATQNVGQLRERLEALRLMFAAATLDDMLSQSVREDWNASQFLDALLRLELEQQEERRVAQAIRISHLPTGPTISDFDFAFQPSVSRNQIAKPNRNIGHRPMDSRWPRFTAARTARCRENASRHWISDASDRDRFFRELLPLGRIDAPTEEGRRARSHASETPQVHGGALVS